jgi:hypothetical protein
LWDKARVLISQQVHINRKHRCVRVLSGWPSAAQSLQVLKVEGRQSRDRILIHVTVSLLLLVLAYYLNLELEAFSLLSQIVFVSN